MSYYGVSIIVTIIATSLIAFYLLYKAKELNLGIVVSISSGSIILGFTFRPAFKAILMLLSDSIHLNKILALLVSLLIVLFVFLLIILILSFIISICIPKKVASIDCCVIIDGMLAKIRIKDGIISIKGKMIGILGKIVSNLKQIVKNAYNLRNKFEKSVDTKQIIDTMGIEKSENGILYAESTNTIDNIDQDVYLNVDNNYQSLVSTTYEEVVTTVISDTETPDGDQLDELEEVDELEDIDKLEDSDVLEDIQELEDIEDIDDLEDLDDLGDIKDIDNINDIDDIYDIEDLSNNYLEEDTVESTEIVSIESDNDIEDENEDSIVNANSLVLKALKYKDDGNKEEAIGHYIEALQYEPDSEMVFWIVLDVCTLYKQLGLSELAKSILEGIVSKYGAIIQPEIKAEIMNNLK